ncbi:male fertility factor kl3 [Carabus blaptoides fortunei]
MGLEDVDDYVKKVIQLYETTVVRHGLMLVGPTGSGKTKADLENMEHNGNSSKNLHMLICLAEFSFNIVHIVAIKQCTSIRIMRGKRALFAEPHYATYVK